MKEFLHLMNLQDEFRNLIIIGDLHGHWEEISQFILKFDLKKTCFYQVGDFGVGLVYDQEPKLNELNQFLKLAKNCLYVNRGNHDDPKYFVEEDLERYSNIKFVPDFTLLDIQYLDFAENLNTIRIFNIGGAISTDRYKRKEGYDWFKGEEIQFDLLPSNFYSEKKYIDIIISHTAPSIVEPFLTPSHLFGEEILTNDLSLIKDIKEERQKLTKLISHKVLVNTFIDEMRFFYGHFHFSSTMKVDNINYSLLNINEFKEVIF